MTLRRLLTASLLWLVCLCARGGSEAPPLAPDSAPQAGFGERHNPAQDSLMLRSHTHDDFKFNRKESPDWWINRIKARDFSMQDTAIIYPRFVRFCVDVYNWADRFFNTYDPEYVESTGKKWKLMVKSSNWTDSYATTFGGTHVDMLSDVYSTFGPTIAFMAVSYSYEANLNQLFTHQPVHQKRFDFNFNTALFTADIYYRRNRGGTIIRRFGDYKNSKGRPWLHHRFPDLQLESYGIDFYYFFNHKRYSQGAAYNFAKYQRRSQGSFITGISVSHQHVDVDFSKLPGAMLTTLPEGFPLRYTYAYNDYCLLLGYGFNWVLGRHWLYNITGLPSLGWKHTTRSCTDPCRDIFSVNLKGKTSFTYNMHQFFLGAFASLDLHWYKTTRLSFANTIFSFGAQVGFRF